MLFYDFEVFQFDWLVVIADTDKKTETVIINDREKLTEFYRENRHDVWAGWNSSRYDKIILAGIILGMNPKTISDALIHEKLQPWQISRELGKIVVNDYDVKQDPSVSLKQVEGYKGLDIVETSVPFGIGRRLTDEELDMTIEYCRNDVQQTMEIFIENRADFNARINLIRTFDLPLHTISLTKAKFMSEIVRGRKRRYDDEYDIYLPENIMIEKYTNVKEYFSKVRSSELNIDVGGVPHTFAWGGIHGAKSRYSHVCNDEELIIHLDVNQMYPNIMIKYNLLSRSCREPDKYTSILDMSMAMKKSGDNRRRRPYKELSNIMYGAMQDEFNPLYDPRNRRLVCLFGQLFMVDIIERLEPFCELIQSNTDGIFVRVDRSDLNRLNDAVKEWEKRTGLNMECKYYSVIVQKDVNNYVAYSHCNGIKAKGGYVSGNDLEIVSQAVIDCLIHDKNPYDTITECTDLRKFQKVVKLSDKFATFCHNGRNIDGNFLRVFASRDVTDTSIGRKKTTYTRKSDKFPGTPERCFIVNENVNGRKVPFKLDRWWYVEQAEKRIREFGKQIYINHQQEFDL